MKYKWQLYSGIFMLLLGILLRKLTDLNLISLVIIFLGVTLKVYYLLKKFKKKEYKPGFELVLLIFGLFLFMTGIYLRPIASIINPNYFIISGIAMKVGFIILYINKTYSKTKNE